MSINVSELFAEFVQGILQEEVGQVDHFWHKSGEQEWKLDIAGPIAARIVVARCNCGRPLCRKDEMYIGLISVGEVVIEAVTAEYDNSQQFSGLQMYITQEFMEIVKKSKALESIGVTL